MGTTVVYPDTGVRKNWEKHGERVSVLDYMVAIPDFASAMNSAITHAGRGASSLQGTRNGISIQMPGGQYSVSVPILLNQPNILLYGEGTQATVITRGATMPAGKGVFHVTASNIKFRDFSVDGAVTTSVGLNYSDFSNDPMNALLTTNTSFWVQGNSSATITDITFENVSIQHTGGYAILFDATVGNIARLKVSNCLLKNNRPHRFGFNNADLNYGSWTGGVHYQGDGTSYGVTDLLVSHCSFERVTGNCIWGHLYAFTTIHHNIRVKTCTFLDSGLDCVLMGGVSGGVVEGCTARRTGYLTSDDTSQSVPKLLPNANAVAFDTSGFCMGVNYINNTSISANGGHLDLDGFTQGTIVGNTCRTPRLVDPEYAEDQIGASGWGGSSFAGGPNYAYGINTGNSSNNQGGEGVTVVGNKFINLCGGSVRLYAGRNCDVFDNDIFAPANSLVAPIVLGNTGSASYHRAIGNVVHGNRIDYSPAASGNSVVAAVYEDGSFSAFQAGDANWVHDNSLTGDGSAVEFQKNPVTSSLTKSVHPSNFAGSGVLTSPSLHYIQREGRGLDYSSALRWYLVEGMNAPVLNMQLQGYRAVGVQEPLLNVSSAGALGTGVYATGNRTQAVFGDCIVTGKGYFDSMLCLADTTYVGGDQTLLPNTVAVVRYISSTGALQTSLAAPSGARQVFSQLAAESTLSRGFVNTSGTGVTWSSGLKFLPWSVGSVMIINGLPYSIASITDDQHAVLATSAPTLTGAAWNLQSPLFNVSANGGAYTGSITTGNRGTSAFDDSMVTGKMYADSLWCLANTTYQDNDANFLPASVGLFRYKLVGGLYQFQISTTVTTGTRDWIPFTAGIGASVDKEILYNKANVVTGDLNLTWDYTAKAVTIKGIVGTPTLNVQVGYTASDGGFTTTSTNFQSIQSIDGGISTAGSAVVPHGGLGGYIGINPLNYGSGTFPSPLAPLVSFGATTVLLWAGAGNGTVTPPTNLGLICNAYINAAVGFVTQSTAYNSIQTPSGGMVAAGLGITDNGTKGGYIGINPLSYDSSGTGHPYPLALPTLSGFGATTAVLFASGVNGTVTPLSVHICTNAALDAAGGLVTLNAATNAIQAPNGGVTAQWLIAQNSLFFLQQGSAPPLSGVNQSRLYLTNTGQIMMSFNTGAYAQIGGSPAGPDGAVQYNSGPGTFAGSGNHSWNNAAQALAITGITGTSGLSVLTSHIASAEGYLTNYTHYQAIQAPNGGITTAGSAVVPISGVSGYGGYIGINPLNYGSGPGATFPVPITPLGSFGATTVLLWAAGSTNGTVTAPSVGLYLNSFINAFTGFVTPNNLYNSIQVPSGGVLTAGVGVTNAGNKGGYIDFPPISYATFPVPLTNASFAASDILLWSAGSNGTVTPVAGALCTNASVDAYVGFIAHSPNYNSIQTLTGGFTGSGLGITDNGTKGGYIGINPLSYGGGTPYPVALVPLPGFAANSVILFAAGVNGTVTPLTTIGLMTNAYINAAAGFVTSNTAFNSIQTTLGGMYAKLGYTSDQAVYLIAKGGTAPNTPAAGYGAWAYKSGTQFYYYNSTTPGWATFDVAGASAAGAAGQIQYSAGSGVFAASDKYTWDNTARAVTINGIAATPGLTVQNGYIGSDGGFTTNSFSYQAIQSPIGGGYHMGIGIVNGLSNTINRGGYIDFLPLSSGTYPVALTNASFGALDVILFACGINGTVTPIATHLCTNAAIDAANGFYSVGANDNIFQAPSGGMTARRHIATYDFVHTGTPTVGAPPAAAGQGKLYFDSNLKKWRATEDTTGPVNLLSGTVGGSDTYVQFNGPQGTGGSLDGRSTFTWNTLLQRLTVTGLTNTAAIVAGTGYIQSDGGFLVTFTNTLWNSIQTSGGIVSTKALQVGSGYTVDQSAGANGFLVNTMGTNTSAGAAIDVWDTSNGNAFIPSILLGRRASGTGTAGGPAGNGLGGTFNFIGTPINTFLFSFGARGSIPGGFTTSASATINIMATENWNSGAQGAEIQFATVQNTTVTRTTRLWMRQDGLVEIAGRASNSGCLLDVGWFSTSDTVNGGYHASGNQFNVIQAPIGGAYVGLGFTCDQALYPKTLGTGTSPNTPAAGYAGFGHRSGSTFWYYNTSTLNWASVDFAATGGGVASINAGSGALTGAITLQGTSGITVNSLNNTITVAPTGLAVLAGQNSFSSTGTNTFSGPVVINGSPNGNFTFNAFSGIFSFSTKIIVGANMASVGGFPAVSQGVYCGPGILMNQGILASGHNIFVQNNGNGTWLYRAGGTYTLPGADGHNYNFEGGVLTAKDGVPYFQTSLTAPF